MNDKIKQAIENLKAVRLKATSSHENLSAICSALYQPEFGWTTGGCEKLRQILIDWLSEYEPADWADSYLDEVGLMRLPKDADSEPIHVGDEMLNFEGERVTVEWVCPGGYMYLENDGYMTVINPHLHHHYHKSTVEDVLREFGDEVRGCCDTEDTIAEYAEKLRAVMADE